MANLSIRPSSELPPIIEILSSDTYATREDMAKAILKAAFDVLRQRELYAVAVEVSPGSPVLFFGIEGTEKSAEAFAEKLGIGSARVVKIHSAGQFEDRAELQRIAAWEVQSLPCETCGHYKWEHNKFVGFNGKATAKQPAKHRCSIDCKCPEYDRPPIPDDFTGDEPFQSNNSTGDPYVEHHPDRPGFIESVTPSWG